MALVLFLVLLQPSLGAAEQRTYTGCCDASAAALVNESLFAVASDEDNVLRLYRRDQGGPPVRTVDVSSFLGLRRRDEADFEGATRLGDLLFWTGSHSRNPAGQPRPSRHVLFATVVRGEGLEATLVPVGAPYRTLVGDLAADPLYREFRVADAASRPPEAPGGWNIEALGTGPDDSLLIGLRNPVPDGRALIVPLLNPRDVIERRPARFGPPLRPDLNGLGLRAMDRAGSIHLLVGGPAEGGGRHRMFLWDGVSERPEARPQLIPRGFQAESVLFLEGNAAGGRLAELLSDDGGTRIGGQRCQDIADPARRRFQVLRVRY
ncbi:MAG: DUF3616 domain-containing protein [Verrucomicrobiae bacterium]|nr:DUF3616 domain-containing protein [Verrucomicrobiae bacterium]